MSSFRDYDLVSETYAQTRWPLPWIITAISNQIPRGADVLDLGCGTGDYLHALSEPHPDSRLYGIDLSARMIGFASRKCPKGHWTIADADRSIPYTNDAFDLVFSVNVMHHLENYPVLFQEIHRVLKTQGVALIFTDSEEDIRARSQTRYFPETLEFNLARYPKISYLKECASAAGLNSKGEEQISGWLELDDRILEMLERKALSELRALPEIAFERGMERVRKDRVAGGQWRSQITLLTFCKM